VIFWREKRQIKLETVRRAIEKSLTLSDWGMFVSLAMLPCVTQARNRRVTSIQERGLLRINRLIHVINRGAHGFTIDHQAHYLRLNPNAILPRVGFLLEIEGSC
jgi:hypothetical protein